jgi:hypothetical protein
MENTKSIAIGIGVAVAIGRCGLRKPIATATPIPIAMIPTQSDHNHDHALCDRDCPVRLGSSGIAAMSVQPLIFGSKVYLFVN